MFHYQTKPTSAAGATNSRLKIFGFQVSDEADTYNSDLPNSKKPDPRGPTTTVSSSGTALGDGRRYECQYCFREFANSQALGGHQNAHKKERKQHKRAQMQNHLHFSNGAGGGGGCAMLFPRNTIVPAAFSTIPVSHHQMIPTPTDSYPNWVYSSHPVPTPAASFHHIPTRGFVLSSNSNKEEGMLSTAYASSSSSSMDRFSSSLISTTSVSGLSNPSGSFSDEILGLDLHLSLAPSSRRST